MEAGEAFQASEVYKMSVSFVAPSKMVECIMNDDIVGAFIAYKNISDNNLDTVDINEVETFCNDYVANYTGHNFADRDNGSLYRFFNYKELVNTMVDDDDYMLYKWDDLLQNFVLQEHIDDDEIMAEVYYTKNGDKKYRCCTNGYYVLYDGV